MIEAVLTMMVLTADGLDYEPRETRMPSLERCRNIAATLNDDTYKDIVEGRLVDVGKTTCRAVEPVGRNNTGE